MHVFDPAEEAVEGGRENDDGNVGAAATEEGGDFGAELAGTKVIIEDSDVDVVEELGGFLDGGGGDALVSMLAEDSRAEMQVIGLVVEKENAYGWCLAVRHLVQGAGYAIGRLNHGLPP
jgi:hypothetical protein